MLDSSKIILVLNNSTEYYWDSSEYSQYSWRYLILIWLLSCCDTIKTVLLDRVQEALVASCPMHSDGSSGEGQHCPHILVKPPRRWLYHSLLPAPCESLADKEHHSPHVACRLPRKWLWCAGDPSGAGWQGESRRGCCGSSCSSVGREELQDELSGKEVYYVASAVKKN